MPYGFKVAGKWNFIYPKGKSLSSTAQFFTKFEDIQCHKVKIFYMDFIQIDEKSKEEIEPQLHPWVNYDSQLNFHEIRDSWWMTNVTHKFLSMYLFLCITLYMFRAHRAHHQERQIVSIQPLVTVTLCQWPCRVQVGRTIAWCTVNKM